MTNYIIYGLLILLFGLITGLILSAIFFPNWEVKRLYRSFLKDGFKLGSWYHYRDVVDHNYRLVVKPNCEILYSSSFIKPKEHGYQLVIPPMNNYFSICFLDKNTDVLHNITNKDLEVDKISKIELRHAQFKSKDDQQTIYLNSNFVWIIARFGLDQVGNVSNVHLLQDQLQLHKV